MITNYKGYLITTSKEFPPLLYVATEGKGGKVPNVLASLFTSVGMAKIQIDKYLETKGKTDAKTGDEGGGK